MSIREQLDKMAIDVPLVGDFHYNGHKLLTDFPDCAKALSKYRINPGNVGQGAKRDTQFAQMIEVACKYDKPVRIGVNWGSLDQSLLARIMDENAQRAEPWDAQAVMYEALVTSAIENARRAEERRIPPSGILHLHFPVAPSTPLEVIWQPLLRLRTACIVPPSAWPQAVSAGSFCRRTGILRMCLSPISPTPPWSG